MINRTRTFASLALVAIAASPWGCGGSSSPSAPTPVAAVPTPTPCAQSLLYQGNGTIPAGTLGTQAVAVPAVGRLDLNLDWTLASNPIGLYVVQGACNLDQFNARSCNFLLRMDPGAKPLKGSTPVQVGAYTVLLANYGSREDSGAIQVVLSTGSCPAATSASSVSIAPSMTNLQVNRVETLR